MAGPSPWTDDRVDELKRLADLALTAGEIGSAMGITRNAALGKLNRIGIRLSNAAAKERQARRPKAIRRTPFVVPKPVVDEVAANVEAEPAPLPFLGVPFLMREKEHCRYPLMIEGDWFFCGQPRITDSSYCNTCHRRCHIRGSRGPIIRDEAA